MATLEFKHDNAEDIERAYRKIDARLRAFGLKSMVLRHEVTCSILKSLEKDSPEKPYVVCAVEAFNRHADRIVDAFREVAHLPASEAGKALATLMMQDQDADLIWSASLRSPEEFKHFIKQRTRPQTVMAGPELTRSALGAPTIQFGAIEKTTDNTVAVLNKWPILRVATFVVSLAAFMAFIVYATR